VVAVGRVTGERDGEHLDSPAAWALKLRNGKVVWARVYEDPEEALKDAGIAERHAK
jgi:ketosteroid isomerase-like protein